ncbi:hypothetical protein AK88_05429 [Plasmodium fragile]|uniref:Schizont-infected cell agglutination extracellular alpha domain-containing protein n=1 Tax=Plasmodium fragile TaxID=5857 RepID=A0A0D9QGT9_PLAFR|nr:uncharacterized protein AK88_05429 [Plasmodium fragile]KJP84941.1 hypothetical protein AK88_05429 [Plasmodium fragile]
MQKEELERMKDVLHDFMDYMEDPYGTVHALGANCYNTGWNDIDQDDIYYKEQTVADVVRCRLLTRALWFANGDNTQHKNANGGSAHMSADEERLRCDVVNAFGYILHHKYCAHKTAWTRGIKYAWKTVKSMGDPGGIKGADRGPVIDARCTECGYDIKNPVVRVVNGHMAQLLIHEGNLMHKIGQLERTAHCAMQWKDYKSGPGRTDGNGNVDWKNIPEVTKTEKEIVQKTQAAIQEVTAKIDEEIEKKKSEQDKGKDTNTTPAEAKKKNEDGKKSTDASTKDQSTEKAQLPAAPVLPARPAEETPSSPGVGKSGNENTVSKPAPKQNDNAPAKPLAAKPQQLMKDVAGIFQDLTQTISQGRGLNAGICGSIYTGAQPNMSTCKSRCMDIVNIMLYIKGYSCSTGNCTKRLVHDSSGDMFMEYLRCTLATEVLLQVYGKTTDHQDVIKKVQAQLQKPDTPGQTQYEPGVCEGWDYGEVIFGVGGIGPGLQQRLDEWKEGLPGGTATSTYGSGQTCAWPEHDRRQKSEAQCTATSGATPTNSELMTRIKHWADSASLALLQKVLEDIQQTGSSMEKCDIEKKIKAQVKNVQDRVNPQAKTPKVQNVNPSGAGNAKSAQPTPTRPGSSGVSSTPSVEPAAAKPGGNSKPAPAKPAAAKPAPPPVDGGKKPVKPVAPQPASTAVATTDGKPTTTGPGATTTTSVGGGGKTGKDGPGAAEKGKTTTKEEDCPWKSILEHKRRPVHVISHYSSDDMEQMKTVLQEFIDYMEKNTDQMDAYGANCDNSGWDDFGNGKDYYTGQTVADVVRCRLMSTALFFANTEVMDGSNGKTDRMTQRFRCEVANVFGYMLKHLYCKYNRGWKRGVEYAWKTFHKMGKEEETGAVTISGPVMDGRCTQCGYKGSWRTPGIIDGYIAEWLVDQGIMGEIAHIEKQMPSEQEWQTYTAGRESEDGSGKVDETKIPEVKTMEKQVVKDTKKAVEKVKKKIEEKIVNRIGTGTGGGTGSTGGADAATTKAPGKNVVSDNKSTCGTQTHTENKKVGDHNVSVTISFVDSSSTGCSGSGTPGSESDENKERENKKKHKKKKTNNNFRTENKQRQ